MTPLHHHLNTEIKAFEIIDFWEEARDIKTFVFQGTLHATPGQFCMLWIPGVDEKPFSIAKDADGEIWLTICKVGEATEELFRFTKGQKIGMRGPFGKGFSVLKQEKTEKNIVLVGGGYGSAPLHFTGSGHMKNNHQVHIIIGARSKDLLIWTDKCKKSGFHTHIMTDDGSAGEKGFTTHALEKLIIKEKIDLIQTCGPEKMMKVVAEIAIKNNIACEVSIERYMKCGFGICGQCVVESGEKMCQQGPVVDAKKALTYEDFGVFHRGAEGQIILW